MNRERMGKNIMELVGTATFLCVIQIAVHKASMPAVAIGVALMTLVYAGGPISGAHYNCAISLAVKLRGKMSTQEMVEYWVAQIVGGVLGALLGGIMCGGAFAALSVGEGATGWQAFLAEVVFTFFLCFVVLSTATSSKADGNSYFGAAIGLTVMVGALSVGSISGGAFNPAVALGLNLSSGLSNMLYCALSVAAELVGGCLAAGLFFVVAPDEFNANGATAGETTSLL